MESLAPTNPVFYSAFMRVYNSADENADKSMEKSLRELTKKYRLAKKPAVLLKLQDEIIQVYKKLMRKDHDNIFRLAVEYSERANLGNILPFEQDKAAYLSVELLKTYVAMKEPTYFQNALSSLCNSVIGTSIMKADPKLVVCLYYMKYYNIDKMDVDYRSETYANMLALYKKAKRFGITYVFKLPRVNAKNKPVLEAEAYNLCFEYFMNNPTQLEDGVNLDLSDF